MRIEKWTYDAKEEDKKTMTQRNDVNVSVTHFKANICNYFFFHSKNGLVNCESLNGKLMKKSTLETQMQIFQREKLSYSC